MFLEVMAAYANLIDDEKRADYHNAANYSKGWLSVARWKSIFLTECHTEEQKRKYKNRLVMMATSVLIGGCGVALTVLSAGTAPVLAVLCATLGAGYIGGGLQSFLRTINRNSIKDGCDPIDYFTSLSLGFLGGAVTGGIGAGITAGITGIGSAAATATIGQSIAIGSGSFCWRCSLFSCSRR